MTNRSRRSSTDAEKKYTFPAGKVVNLNGDKVAPFFWGYWTGTAGDTGPSHDTSKTTTVTMTGDKTVLACCPTTSGGTCP